MKYFQVRFSILVTSTPSFVYFLLFKMCSTSEQRDPKPQPLHPRVYSSSCTAKTIEYLDGHVITSALPAVSVPLPPAELSLPQCMLWVFNARHWACLVYIPSCLKESLLKWGLRAAGEPPPQERFELGEGKSSANEEPASSTMLCS